MFAQYGDSAGHRRIEIDMQIADKVVSHASNLYLGIWGVKGTDCELVIQPVLEINYPALKVQGFVCRMRMGRE